MTEIGPQFEGVSPIWKKEAREMDAVDARQKASKIHVYQGDGWTMPDGEVYNTVYAAKSAGYGRHTIVGRALFHPETGVAHVDTHPDLAPSQRGLAALSMLKVADKLHRAATGRGITTNYQTSNEGNRFAKSLLPKSAAASIDAKRADAIKDLLYPDETAAENGLGWDDDDLKQMYTDLSKDSKKRIKLQSIYDSKTLKPNGKKTWLA
jgi:hypothetical protein